MPLVSYSPYEDAANLGQGLGSTFANIALQLPQIRMQQLQQQALLKRLPYELALEGAQTAAEQARGRRLDSQTQTENATRQGKVDYGNARTKTEGEHGDLYKAQADSVARKGQVIPNNGMLLMPGGERVTGNVNLPAGGAAFQNPTGQPGNPMAQVAMNPKGPGTAGNPSDIEFMKAATDLVKGGQAGSMKEAAGMVNSMLSARHGDTNTTGFDNPNPQDGKPLDANMASQFLKQAGGDKEKARSMAKQAGYNF